ncbi:MAG: hypothetical protein AAF184_23725 [Pseudomonadota bacterium]
MGVSLVALLALGVSPSAFAAHLEVPSSAPAIAYIGAALVLYLHTGGGAVGLASGVAAAVARKGGPLHRAAGYTFVVSMGITYLIGALVAPFLTEGQRPNFVAGVLALYLLGSGVATARRRQFRAGWAEKAGLAVAFIITAMGITFMVLGANSPSGTVDGSPPQAFVLFVVVGVVAVIGEGNALARGQLAAAARTSRHLWRMCVSFFIASGSLFLGQPQVFPQAFSESIAPLVLAFVPVLVMVVFLVKARVVRAA